MKRKRVVLYFGLVIVTISTGGCLYLRLMEFKNQLTHFDDYFQIKQEHGLTLVSAKPVLLSGDVTTMLKVAPTSVRKTDAGVLWVYVFEKQYPDTRNEQGNYDIPLELLFEDDKLSEIRFSQRFLAFMRRPTIILFLRALGGAKLDVNRRSATGSFRGKDPQERTYVPKKQNVLKLLGKPFAAEPSKDTIKLTYRYRLKVKQAARKDKGAKDWAHFTFRKTDGMLMQIDSNFGGIKISTSFLNGSSNNGSHTCR